MTWLGILAACLVGSGFVAIVVGRFLAIGTQADSQLVNPERKERSTGAANANLLRRVRQCGADQFHSEPTGSNGAQHHG